MIQGYFEQVEKTIFDFLPYISSHEVSTKLYSRNKGFIKGVIVFIDDCSLLFAEVIDIDEPFKIKYRYHFMDGNRQLIFRYDNSAHYPELRTHPHHKHLKQDVVASLEPTLSDVLIEIFNLNFKADQ